MINGDVGFFDIPAHGNGWNAVLRHAFLNGVISRLACLSTCALSRRMSNFFCRGSASFAKLIHFFLGEMLNSNEGVGRSGHSEEFIKLSLNGGSVPILCILDQKDHEKRYDSSSGVDDELPCVGKPKKRARCGPRGHHYAADDECDCVAGSMGHAIGDLSEPLIQFHWRLLFHFWKLVLSNVQSAVPIFPVLDGQALRAT